MKATGILSLLLLLLCLPFMSSCSRANAAALPQGKPREAKPDVTFTGKVGQWGVVDNGSVYFEFTGTNMKGEEGTIWLRADSLVANRSGLALKVLTILLHTDGQLAVEGKKRGSNDGSTALRAMDLLKIGKFKPVN